jgi:hypothetical protein
MTLFRRSSRCRSFGRHDTRPERAPPVTHHIV